MFSGKFMKRIFGKLSIRTTVPIVVVATILSIGFYLFALNGKWDTAFIKEVTEYGSILNAVKKTYGAVMIIFALGVLLMIVHLNQSVKTPIRKIINSIKSGQLPEYKGIDEFELLSDTIRQIMTTLNEEKEWTNRLFSAIGSVIIVIDTDGKIMLCNKAFKNVTGYTLEESEGRYFWELLVPDSQAEETEELIKQVLGDAASGSFESYIVTKSGEKIYVLWNNSTLSDERGSARWIILSGIDVSKRKHAEEELAAEKKRLAVTLRSIADGVIATDSDGRIVLINEVAQMLTGWSEEEALGKSVSSILTIKDDTAKDIRYDLAQRVLETKEIAYYTDPMILVSKDGSERIVAHSVAPIRNGQERPVGVTLVFRDITLRCRMERELQKSQKLESIGVLAGGIAHDFNNILTGIMGSIALAKLYCDSKEKTLEILSEAEKGAFRARDLTQQLLTFSEGGAPIKKTASIEELLEDTIDFALSGSNIKTVYSIPPDPWSVEIDRGQISQVINNLALNAKQSMPHGGTIRVKTENVHLGKENLLQMSQGKYIKISIKDEGDGIAREHISKVFDPYFTTKKNGSGLGLSTSYSIIKRHEGHISVDSEAGKGATFFIYLPASGERSPDIVKKRAEVVMGEGRILLVDDDEAVLRVGGAMLKHLGYETSLARDGAEAIGMFNEARESDHPYDILIMDLTIPGGMGGKEAIEHISKIDPNVRAIVSSGYSNDPVMSDFAKYGFSGVVAKPYMLEELSNALSKILTGSPIG